MTMHRPLLLALASLVTASTAVHAQPPAGGGGGNPKSWTTTGNAGTNPAVNFLGTTDGQDLAIRTNGSEKVRVTTGGHVGIGTPSPVASLDVSAANPFSPDTVVVFRSDTGQAGLFLHSLDLEPYLTFGNRVEGASSTMFLDRTTDALHFCVASTPNCQFATQVRLSIEPSGDVGIGTKTPESALQVVGYAQLDLTSGAPPAADCDQASERGRMKVDSAAGSLYVCVDAGWMAK
jgi:hypothetical protein